MLYLFSCCVRVIEQIKRKQKKSELSEIRSDSTAILKNPERNEQILICYMFGFITL